MSDCFICEGEASGKHSLETYEDLLVDGSGGYQPVCERCYYLAIGYCSQHAGAIPIHEIRLLIREAPEVEFLVSLNTQLQRECTLAINGSNRINRLLGVRP